MSLDREEKEFLKNMAQESPVPKARVREAVPATGGEVKMRQKVAWRPVSEATDGGIKDGTPCLLYSPTFVDAHYNETGVVEGFLDSADGWYAAVYSSAADKYATVLVSPSHFALINPPELAAPAVGGGVEVHRYQVVKMLSEGGNKIEYTPHGPWVVMADVHEAHVTRLTAENAQLQEIYNDTQTRLIASRKEAKSLEVERDALKAELAELADLKAYVTIPLRERCAQRLALQSELTKARVWERFAGYLLDNCEGQQIYEERLQYWLSEMLRKEKEQSVPAAQALSMENQRVVPPEQPITGPRPLEISMGPGARSGSIQSAPAAKEGE